MTLVAAGDSMVHAADSWPEWLARAMSQELRRVSANGARADDVLGQVEALGSERYDVACLSVGGNDALFDWDPDRYAERLDRILAILRAHADRVVAATVTRSLGGFPGSGRELGRRVDEVNAALRGSGVLLTSGEDLTGPRLLQADRIHPTAAGQLVLADRAAAALGVTPLPSELADTPAASERWAYHRVAVAQAPRRAAKRLLGRPMYRDPRQ
jgi:lysophospholipase L1-like esterase